MKSALVILADGFEEMEAFAPIDILRRTKEVEVTLCGLTSLTLVTSHGVKISADTTFDKIDLANYDALIIPGGLKGTKNIIASFPFLQSLIENSQNLVIGAICAAPALVLGQSGLLEGQKATCHPSVASWCPFIEFSQDNVVVSNNIITAKSAYYSLDFAIEVARKLVSKEAIERVLSSLCAN